MWTEHTRSDGVLRRMHVDRELLSSINNFATYLAAQVLRISETDYAGDLMYMVIKYPQLNTT